jgi:hypothetical protein
MMRTTMAAMASNGTAGGGGGVPAGLGGMRLPGMERAMGSGDGGTGTSGGGDGMADLLKGLDGLSGLGGDDIGEDLLQELTNSGDGINILETMMQQMLSKAVRALSPHQPLGLHACASRRAKWKPLAFIRMCLRTCIRSLSGLGIHHCVYLGRTKVVQDFSPVRSLVSTRRNAFDACIISRQSLSACMHSAQVLHQPLVDMGAKYPEWLAANAATTSAEEMERYRRQHGLVQQLIQVSRSRTHFLTRHTIVLFEDGGFAFFWGEHLFRLGVHAALALIDGGVHAKAVGHEDLVHHAHFRRLVLVSLALGHLPPQLDAKVVGLQSGLHRVLHEVGIDLQIGEVYHHVVHLQLVFALLGGEVPLLLGQRLVSAQQHGPVAPGLSVLLLGLVRSSPAQEREGLFRDPLLGEPHPTYMQ